MVVDTGPKCGSMTSDKSSSMFIYSLPEVDADVSYFTSLEDEVAGLQHFLLGPECNRDCLDGAANFNAYNVPKGFCVDSFLCAFKLDEIKFDSDALDLFLTQNGEVSKIEGCTESMRTPDENVCGKFIMQPTCAESLVGDLALESESPCLQTGGCDFAMSDLASEGTMVPESTCDQDQLLPDQIKSEELKDVLIGKFGCRPTVPKKQLLKNNTFCSLQKNSELINIPNLLGCGNPKFEEEKTTFLSSMTSLSSAPDSIKDTLDSHHLSGDKHMESQKHANYDSFKCPSLIGEAEVSSVDKSSLEDALVPQMRPYKRTRTCNNGSQKQKSRYHLRKNGTSHKNSSDNFQHLGAARLVCQEESFKGSDTKFSFGIKVQTERAKQTTSFSAFDSEDSKENEASVSNEDFGMELSTEFQHEISEDDCFTSSNTHRGRRQKRRHRKWTTSEVKKLIEGVSCHGVGKWTEMKRLLFSSSHRSSINLKDKWRNLVKASCNQDQRKREVEQAKRQASSELPESILRQVRDLALEHSYPRRRGPIPH